MPGPGAPGAPGLPLTPAAPAGPVAPSWPATPAGPAGPALPCGPLAFHTSGASPGLHGRWSTIRKPLGELRQQARIFPDELTPEYDAAARPPPAATRTAATPMAVAADRDFFEIDIRRMSRL